ncbi:peptidase M23 [Chromobacterium sp. LK1]|nr:peptidase M23 [Chromobacterium sp. LK1]
MLKMHCSYAYIFTASIGIALSGCTSIAQQAAPVESGASAATHSAPPPAPVSTPAATGGGAAVATPYQDNGGVSAAPIGSATAAGVTAKEKTHVVQPGENLFRISLNNGLKYKDVAEWNKLPDNNIKVGQVLRLTPPGSDTAVAAPAAGASQPATTPAQPSAPVESATNRQGGIKAYPKALKLPYSAEAAKSLSAQSEGGPGNNKNAQAPINSASTAAASAPAKAEAPAATTPSAKPEASKPAAKADEDAVPWLWPTEGKMIKGYSDSSKGIDISGRNGQPVLAAGDGKVVYSGTGLRGYGKLIIIKHNKSFLSAYAHNSQLLVKEGQSVKRGQKIAEMGNSDADQVKLHFEIRRFGKPVDPMQYLDHKS